MSENIEKEKNYVRCFSCMLLGERRSLGRTFPVTTGPGIRLCEEHLKYYLSLKLDELSETK